MSRPGAAHHPCVYVFLVGLSARLSLAAAPWTCAHTRNATARASPFCAGVPPPRPGACTSDGVFDSDRRTAKAFAKQAKQCATKKARRKTCPNDPAQCARDVLNQTAFCGGHDQACNVSNTCLPFCYADCYPCNARSDCDLLVSFGVAAAPGAPCFSLEPSGGSPLPASRVRAWLNLHTAAVA